ncbi:hypothetical protein HYH03_000199 [Edaphochlamys debaryana]|uniref:Exocyst complex component EXOC2/Sec5 N-terminal domain-containing protein n=1 Tax=Edaphochlamys debaryana TaxID=47281 RepID=A0A835YH35_9CHLO|nr:hypothetical protein HYH03_000199 [Edaphochlamys debaryana]|eukprot:KAG2501697.1 hypothetical protein HYH03_000199 [Edaphochlamys debaryana]
MSDAESDVSAITLSDEEKAQKPRVAGGVLKSAAVAKAGTGGAGGTKAGKHRVSFQVPEEVYEEEEDDDGGGGRGRGRGKGRGEAQGEEDDGRIEDESKPLGWSYFRKKDPSEGPVTWDEVDTAELGYVAENLVRSTTTSANSQTDEVIQQIFQAGLGEVDATVKDPLGRGIIDPVSLTLIKKSKRAAREAAALAGGGKGPKANTRGFRSAKLGAGAEAQAGAAAEAEGPALDEEARRVLPNQEGFEPEAYLATFHADSSLSQLEKGLKSLSRELSERTGQLKKLIRNNFDRFINCKDAIDDIHSKLRKMLVKGGGIMGGGGGGGGGPGGSGASFSSQGGVGTDRIHKSLEQVDAQAKRTFGPILDRAAKADRIRAVASLMQRFDHLFAAPQRIVELAHRGELEQVVREYKRANLLIKPTPTTARVWVSLYGEIEKRATEVFSAVRQLVTDPPPESPPLGQDGPGWDAAAGAYGAGAGPSGSGPGADSALGCMASEDARRRLGQLPDYLLFMCLMRQERLPLAREDDPMKLFVGRLQAHVEARMQDCDRRHTQRLGQLVTTWMRAAGLAGSGPSASSSAAAAATAPSAGGGGGGGGSGHPPARSISAGAASLQSSLSVLGLRDLSQQHLGAAGAGANAGGGGAEGEAGPGPSLGLDDDGEDLDEEGEAAEAAFLLWQGSLAQSTSPFSDMAGAPGLPYHIRIELRRLVQDPGGHGGTAAGYGYGGEAAGAAEPLPVSAHAPEPVLTAGQRQWVSYVCSVSDLLLWAVPGLWATCNSPKYGAHGDLDEQSKEGLAKGPSLARRLVEALVSMYALRLRRAAQSLARAGPTQPGLPLIVKDACHLWSSLARAGVGSRALGALREGVLAALGLHVGVLGDHLAALPLLLFAADDFRLDLLAPDSQPVTALPRRLEEEVGVALLHYQWPLRAVVEAAGGVDDVPPESSWKPMQGSVLACFAQLSEALAEYARSLYADASAGGSGKMMGPNRSLEESISLNSNASAHGPTPSTHRGASAFAAEGLDPMASLGSSLSLGTSVGGPGAGDEGGRGAAGGSNDVRVLLVTSNSTVIRTRVMPGVVDRYRRLLAPSGDALALCQKRQRELTTSMRRSNEALGSSYLFRKEQAVQAAVERYVAAESAPLPGSELLGPGGAGAGGKRGAGTGGRMLPSPAGPTPGCEAVLGLLMAIHNESLKYSPSNLRSFMEALAERLVESLHRACRGLAEAAQHGPAAGAGAERARGRKAAAVGPGPGPGEVGPSVEQLVALWADTAFLSLAMRPLLTSALAGQLKETKVALGDAVVALQGARRYRPASSPAAAVMGLGGGQEVSAALSDLLLAPIKSEWLSRHALNIRCFAAMAPPPAQHTAVAPPPAGPEAAAQGRARRGAGEDAETKSTRAGGSESPPKRQGSGAAKAAVRAVTAAVGGWRAKMRAAAAESPEEPSSPRVPRREARRDGRAPPPAVEVEEDEPPVLVKPSRRARAGA